MKKDILEKRDVIISKYEMDKSFIKYNLKKEKVFKIPTNNGIASIEGSDLSEWIIENQSKDEIRVLVEMIKKIKKRNMSIRPLFKTLGIGLFSKGNFVLYMCICL